MDGRNEQPYFTYSPIGEIKQVLFDFFMVQVRIFLTDFCGIDLNPRMGFDIVIFAGVTFFQDFINSPATMTAKWLFIEDYGYFPAIVPAVVTT